MDIENILAIISLGLAVFFFGVSVYHGQVQHKQESKWALWACMFFIILATVVGLMKKWKAKNSTVQDYLSMLIVLIATVLAILAFNEKWGDKNQLLISGMIVLVGLLGTCQVVLGDKLNKQV